MMVHNYGERAWRPRSTAGARLPELDSLRGLAALGVVLWHYSGIFHQQPLAAPLAAFYRSGGLLVDFFFVLSGFVLSRSYDTDGRREQFAGNLRQRIARLYPLHLLTLLAVLACDQASLWLYGNQPYQYNDAYHFVLNLLLLQSSGLQQDYSFNAPSWSVSTEFLANVLFLGLIAYGRRWGRWLMAALALGCAGLLLRVGMLNHGEPVAGKLAGVLDLALVRSWFGFCVGMACYRFYRWKERAGPSVPKCLGDALGIVALGWVGAYMARALPQSHPGDVLLAALAFPTLLLATLGGDWLRRLLRWRVFTYLGEISYSIYLVHFPLMLVLLAIAGPSHRYRLPFAASPWFLLAFYALVVSMAALSYRYVERSGQRLLGRAVALPAGAVAMMRPVRARRSAQQEERRRARRRMR